ncbi:MAG: hypothetical protein JW794_02080 [Candidatus Cloacimonetes bacterium]|nr:hypothetical protein [Candidatus Cloacimonadota bacterium]
MKKRTNITDKKEIQILTQDGKEFEVPVEGSLGLLALGAVGIQAWRKKQREMNYKNPNENVIVEKKEQKKDKNTDE